MNNSPQRAAKGFTRAFWVSNTVELFERMAFPVFSPEDYICFLYFRVLMQIR